MINFLKIDSFPMKGLYKMKLSKNVSLFLATIILIFLLTACGSGEAVEKAEQYMSSIEELDIPDDVKVIGFGEATHGNIELQALKKDVFKALMENENIRVFVLEGDFGGGQKINEFILNGTGTAKEAVNALDYGIYKTKQMIELVQWMRDYNVKVNEDEKIYFYGNDMQRYDNSKKGLLNFYEVVNAKEAERYTEQMENASNDTMRELTEEQLKELEGIIDNIISDLQSNEAKYIEESSPEAFAFALQHAEILRQRTQLLLNEENYTDLRDEYLAENLQWIVEFEADRGHDKVFVSAHNGHIEKTSASLAGYTSMGDYLDEVYGESYFAIGTDTIKNTFQARKGNSENRKNFSIKNRNDLVDAFKDVEQNIFYVDFAQASESDELLDIITTEQKMVNIGDEFRSWYKLLSMFYTIKMTPNEAYDGVIIIKEATPTTVIH